MDIQRRRPEPHFHAVNELSNRHALRAKEIVISEQMFFYNSSMPIGGRGAASNHETPFCQKSSLRQSIII